MLGSTFNFSLGIKPFTSPLYWPSSKKIIKKYEREKRREDEKEKKEMKMKKPWRKKEKGKKIEKKKEEKEEKGRGRRKTRRNKEKFWMPLIFEKVNPYVADEHKSASIQNHNQQ